MKKDVLVKGRLERGTTLFASRIRVTRRLRARLRFRFSMPAHRGLRRCTPACLPS